MSVLTKKAPTLVNPRDFMGSYAPDCILALTTDKLKPGPKIVYIVLLRHMGKKTLKAFPSMPTIARHSGFSARQVRRHVETLGRLGFIQITHTGRSNNYRFLFHRAMIGAKFRPTAVTRRETEE